MSPDALSDGATEIGSPGLHATWSSWGQDGEKEVYSSSPATHQATQPPGKTRRRICGLPAASFWVLIVLAILITIGLGVGLGVGLGMKHGGPYVLDMLRMLISAKTSQGRHNRRRDRAARHPRRRATQITISAVHLTRNTTVLTARSTAAA